MSDLDTSFELQCVRPCPSRRVSDTGNLRPDGYNRLAL
jgi:hypothetical protein